LRRHLSQKVSKESGIVDRSVSLGVVNFKDHGKLARLDIGNLKVIESLKEVILAESAGVSAIFHFQLSFKADKATSAASVEIVSALLNQDVLLRGISFGVMGHWELLLGLALSDVGLVDFVIVVKELL
jgi:hypothetical protein